MRNLAAVILFFVTAISGLAQDSAPAQGDTVRLRNGLIELTFQWNGGNLIPLSLKNRVNGEAIRAGISSPLYTRPEMPEFSGPGTLTRQRIESTDRVDAHVLYTAEAQYSDFRLRHHLMLFDELPVFVHRLEIKFLKPAEATEVEPSDGASSMIENLEILQGEPLHYSHFPFLDTRFTLEAVRFFDATDHHSNPVQSDRFMPYAKRGKAQGNVFLLEDAFRGYHHMVLKEAPLGQHQADYPGCDITFAFGGIGMQGSGISPTETGQWQQAYEVVYGCFAESETDARELLLRYKLARYRYLPEIDHTFTLNTWGDRNRDARVSESFILSEVEKASALGITHYQIDDGWQAGLSRNSAQSSGENWESWTRDDWNVHPKRFPKGLRAVANKADKYGVELGLWYNPGGAAAYANMDLHLDVFSHYREKFDVRLFKIDGVELGDKTAENNLASLLDSALALHPDLVFNMDVTAGVRGGYHYLDRYGSIFLENRYTDWGNYYPHLTLRSAWQLAHYMPLQRLQVSFLNKWRNTEKYPKTGLRPATYSFDYLFATTMMAQPLAWFEATGLPEEAFEIKALVDLWKEHRSAWSTVPLIPVGEEPSGRGFTGFAASADNGRQYFLFFRESTIKEDYSFDWPFEIRATASVHVLYQSNPVTIEHYANKISVQFNENKSFVWGYIE